MVRLVRAPKALKDEEDWEPNEKEELKLEELKLEGAFPEEILGGKSPSKKYTAKGKQNQKSQPANRTKEIEELEKEIVRIQKELQKRGVITLPDFEKRFADEQKDARRSKAKTQKKKASKIKVRRKTKYWRTRAVELTRMLFASRDSLHFRAPVDHVRLQIPKYPEIIKEPMDLGTITLRIKNPHYKRFYPTPADWAKDVRLVFRNAMLFNGRLHIVHLLALRQLNEFNRLLEIYKPEIGVDAEKHINILAGLEKIPAPFPRFKEACNVLEYFLSHKKTLPFLTPVNSLIIKRYREVVHRPRDLSMIRVKMTKYTDFDQFTMDMRLVFSNAMLYNAQGSPLHNVAVCLLEELECKLEEIESKAKEAALKLEEERQFKSLSKGKEDELKLESLSKAEEDELKLEPVILPTSIATGKKVKAPVFKKNKKKMMKKATKAKKQKPKKARASPKKNKRKTPAKKRSTRKAKKKKAEVQGRRSKRVRNQ